WTPPATKAPGKKDSRKHDMPRRVERCERIVNHFFPRKPDFFRKLSRPADSGPEKTARAGPGMPRELPRRSEKRVARIDSLCSFLIRSRGLHSSRGWPLPLSWNANPKCPSLRLGRGRDLGR